MIPANCHYCDAIETFDHLVWCPKSPHSNATAKTLDGHLRQLCHRYKAPPNILLMFTTVISDWFGGHPPLLQKPTPQSAHRVISQQSLMGWDMWFRGFFTQQWIAFIQLEFDRPDKHMDDCPRFLAQVVTALWQTLSDAWDTHLSTVHDSMGPHQSPEQRLELGIRISHLHSLSQEVLAAHRTLYFHEDWMHSFSTHPYIR